MNILCLFRKHKLVEKVTTKFQPTCYGIDQNGKPFAVPVYYYECNKCHKIFKDKKGRYEDDSLIL